VALIALGLSIAGSAATLAAPAEAYARIGLYAAPGGAQTVAVLLLQTDLVLAIMVGLLLCLRLPRHPIGWLLLSLGSLLSIGVLASGWMLLARGAGTALPGGRLAAWVFNLIDGPVFGIIGTILSLFPTGRGVSGRWLRALVAALIIEAGAFLFLALVPGPLQMTTGVSNPIGARVIGAVDRGLLESAFVIGVVGPPLVGAGSMVRRFRHASQIERLQLRWVAAAGALIPIVYVALVARVVLLGSSWDAVSDAIGFASFGTIPVATGIAILRYRLYAIDVIIRRTLLYGPLTVTLGVCYGGLVIALQTVLGGFAGQDGLVVAVATLVVAAAFRPLRQRLQDVVDRHFYRVHYDASRTVDTLSKRVRMAVDRDAIETDLLAAVATTVGPSTIGVWMRTAPRDRSDVATRPGRVVATARGRG